MHSTFEPFCPLRGKAFLCLHCAANQIGDQRAGVRGQGCSDSNEYIHLLWPGFLEMLHWSQICDCYTVLRFTCSERELICDGEENSDLLRLARGVKGEVIACKLEICGHGSKEFGSKLCPIALESFAKPLIQHRITVRKCFNLRKDNLLF